MGTYTGMNIKCWHECGQLVTIYDIRELQCPAVRVGDRHEQEQTAVVLF